VTGATTGESVTIVSSWTRDGVGAGVGLAAVFGLAVAFTFGGALVF